MEDALRFGFGRRMLPVPRAIWKLAVSLQARGFRKQEQRMSSEQRDVRRFAVTELQRFGAPLPPERIAKDLGLGIDRVVAALDHLEAQLRFLVRDEHGAVTWAYPVTVDKTPHHLTFESGERIHAA